LTVKGDTFHLGIKSPKIKKEKSTSDKESLEEEAFFIAAAGNLEDGIALLDSFFCAFLSVRLGPSWGSVRQEIKAIIDG
jgi:hypothetical protein